MNDIVTGRKTIIENNNAIYPRSTQDELLYDVRNPEAQQIIHT